MLRIAVVRRLVVTYSISAIGSGIGSVAVAFVAYRESRSVILTVVVFAGNTLPYILLAPASGRLMTRVDGRFLLVTSLLGKTTLLFAEAMIAGFGELTYGILLGGSFVYGALSALSAPVWPRLNEVIAPPGRLAEYTALFQACQGAATVAGALAGGLLLVSVGEAWAFAVDAVTYVPVALVVMRSACLGPEPGTRGGVLRSGARTILRIAPLRRAFLLASVLNLAAFSVLSVLPALADEIEPSGHILGFLTGAFYAGAALVALAMVQLRRRFHYSQILVWGFFTAGVMLLVHVALTYWRDPGYDAATTAAITLVPIGLAVSMNAALLQALVQLETEHAQKASVILVYATATSLLTPLGGVAIGVAVDAWSLWWALATSGVVLILIALVLRRRLAVFDALDPPHVRSDVHGVAHHPWSLHLRHALIADLPSPHHAVRD